MDFSQIKREYIDPLFLDIIDGLEPLSVMGSDKMYNVWQFARQCSWSNAAEFGVYKGGTAKLIWLAGVKSLHLYDTFEGMPDSEDIDFHKKGDFKDTRFEDVQGLFDGIDHVYLHKGLFQEVPKPEMTYSFVHLDADLYSSTKAGLEYFYPRMQKGGVILLDDWGWENCEGVFKATQEFLEDKPEICIDLHTYQGVIVKR